jgi:hypothetical protein
VAVYLFACAKTALADKNTIKLADIKDNLCFEYTGINRICCVLWNVQSNPIYSIYELRSIVSNAEEKQEEVTEPKVDQHPRANAFESCAKTFDYLSRISTDKSLTFRQSDTTTTNLLVFSLVGALVFAVLPAFNLSSVAAICYVIADVLLIMAILGFVMSRFGILRTMEPRYAMVCWHLMVGTGLLAMVIGFNIVIAIVLIVFQTQITNALGIN